MDLAICYALRRNIRWRNLSGVLIFLPSERHKVRFSDRRLSSPHICTVSKMFRFRVTTSVLSKLCACARAHGFQKLRTHIYCAQIYHDEAMFSVGKLRKIVLGPAKRTHFFANCTIYRERKMHLQQHNQEKLHYLFSITAILNLFMGFCTNVSHF